MRTRSMIRWRIEGALNGDTAPGFRTRLLSELCAEESYALTLDLSRVDAFDTAGLQLLLALERALGAGLIIERPAPIVAEVLEWTRLRRRCIGSFVPARSVMDEEADVGFGRTRGGRTSGPDWLIGIDSWHVSLRFDPKSLRSGPDPVALVRGLAVLGALVHVIVVDDRLPALDELSPGTCRIGFEIDLRSDAEPAVIREALDAACPNAWVRAIAPCASIDEYVLLIHELPEGALRASRLMLASGVLTPAELETGLRSLVRGGMDRPQAAWDLASAQLRRFSA